MCVTWYKPVLQQFPKNLFLINENIVLYVFSYNYVWSCKTSQNKLIPVLHSSPHQSLLFLSLSLKINKTKSPVLYWKSYNFTSDCDKVQTNINFYTISLYINFKLASILLSELLLEAVVITFCTIRIKDLTVLYNYFSHDNIRYISRFTYQTVRN